MTRRLRFTLYHGFAASLLIHALLAVPVAIYAFAATPDDDDTTLVIDLNGVIADDQSEQKVQQETKGVQNPQPTPAVAPATPSPAPQESSAESTETAPVSAAEASESPPQNPTQSMSADANNVRGTDEQQNAQTIKPPAPEIDDFSAYVKLLTKKIQGSLVYPDEGRRVGLQGTATVAFTITETGQVRPETIKIVESSGQRTLDASALQTVRASAPFDPPPKEITVAVAVVYGRKN